MASIIKADTLQSTTANVFVLNSSGTEYARFDSSGNLGIGAASPNTTTKFYVEQSGSGNVLGYFNSTATAQNARLRINSTDNASSVAHVWSYSHASLNKQVSAYLTGAGALAIQAGQTAGSEPTSGTTSAIFNQYGIGLGGTNPSNGTGIAFPATQSASSDANTLDDYEEGTWTVSIGGTATYTNQLGRYTKIGNLVCIEAHLTILSIGSGLAGGMSGLPFVHANDTLLGTVTFSYFGGLVAGATFLAGYISPNTINITLTSTNSAVATTANPSNSMTTGTDLYFSATYRTT